MALLTGVDIAWMRVPDRCLADPACLSMRLDARANGSDGSAKIDMAMNYRNHIERDPRVVGGEPVLKGTRVTLRTVLASLAEGATTAEILADFPTLRDEDVRAAIAFAATSAQEDLPVAESPIR
jgi:uncharacterized protein (DUF433 family)